jgi:phospholipid/cholesterol/gamma-HCH transport system permease protein
LVSLIYVNGCVTPKFAPTVAAKLRQFQGVERHVIETPLLRATQTSGQWQLVATGAWTGQNAGRIDDAIAALDRTAHTCPGTLDMRAVEQLDTFGAWLIESLIRRWQASNQVLKIVGLRDHLTGLVDAVHRTPPETTPPPAEHDNTFTVGLITLGHTVSDAGRDLTGMLNMLGATVQALGRVVAHPRTFRLTATVHHLDRAGWQAVPIVLLITFLIGCIIAQQGFFHFRKFGADEYVVDMVGILVLREIGVLIVAIMVAGRSGSSYTAELGAMKMREEIDALRTMGLDPVQLLILPRILALLIALPILTFLGSMSALYGGGLVAWFYGGMSPEIFIARLQEAISITHFKVGMIKAPFMALVIGIVASTEGFKVKGSAESLGLQTTASVVSAIFLVIILDGLFAIFFASIGM